MSELAERTLPARDMMSGTGKWLTVGLDRGKSYNGHVISSFILQGMSSASVDAASSATCPNFRLTNVHASSFPQSPVMVHYKALLT